jgi:hypothetical protein
MDMTALRMARNRLRAIRPLMRFWRKLINASDRLYRRLNVIGQSRFPPNREEYRYLAKLTRMTDWMRITAKRARLKCLRAQ